MTERQISKTRRLIQRALQMLESGSAATASHLLREALDILQPKRTPPKIGPGALATMAIAQALAANGAKGNGEGKA